MNEATRGNVSVSSARTRGSRQRHTVAKKLAIVRECLAPGASLAGVALAHQVNANMVRKWVVKYQQGGYGELSTPGTALLPVVIKPRSASRAVKVAEPRSAIEIELVRGTVRFHGSVDRTLLRLVIDALSA